MQFFYMTLLAIVIFPNIFQDVDYYIDFHPFGRVFYFSASDYAAINLLVFTYLLVFIAVEIIFKSPHLSLISDLSQTEKNISSSIHALPFFLFCVYLIWLINKYGLTTLGAISFLDIRGGAIGRHYLVMSYLGIMSAFLPAYFYHQKNSKIAALSTLIVLSAFFGLLGGSRQILVVACVAFITPFVDRRSGSLVIWILLITIGFPLLENSLAFVKALRNASNVEARIDLVIQMVSGTDVLQNTSLDGSVRHVFNMFLSTDPPPRVRSRRVSI